MADRLEIKLTGLDDVVAKMRGLAPDLRAKGARRAMRKAAGVVRLAAMLNALAIDDPETKESIAKNLTVRFSARRLKQTGDVMMRVGVLGGARQYSHTKENVRKGRAGQLYKTGGDKSNPGGDTFYWRFVEFGTAHARAQPFLRPALENNIDRAIDVATAELGKAIDRIAAKRQSLSDVLDGFGSQ